ncbi:MAG TPA: MFS transporter [Acidobacteriaceae bacterium]|jgi:PAT family beta-lactamase induction signal transducer AmpG
MKEAHELDSAAPSERPWIYGLLIAPSAVVANGVIQGGALSYMLRQQGVGIGRTASVVTLLALPTSLYFLWSPITDFFVRRRTWLLIGAVLSAMLMTVALSEHDLASHRAITLILISACCSQLVVSSCGGMMGALRRERSKRVAGSFYQGGSLGFGQASVSLLIPLYGLGKHGLLGLAAGSMIVLPALFALAAPPQDEVPSAGFGEAMERLKSEFAATFLRWRALPYTLMMLFPMCSGSAVSLLPGIAQDYGVSPDQIAWMNGMVGALLTAAGSLAASLLPARARASVTYLSLGLVNAATLCVLWLGPLRPWVYLSGATLYLFTVGACYALFTAVVLEFLGRSGKSGSSRYSIINSLGNVPVLYMIKLEGMGGSRWGPRGVPATEAVLSAVGGGALLVYFLLKKRNETVDEELADIEAA